jgi:hypothetical protein
MILGARVKTPRGLGILEHEHPDGTCAVRLINDREWPFPEWVFLPRDQIKWAPKKDDLSDFEDATF